MQIIAIFWCTTFHWLYPVNTLITPPLPTNISGVLILKRVLLKHSQQRIYDSVGIVGAVRAGLVIQLKESLGTQAIMSRHEKLCK